jgi:hypothetical protein
MSTLFTLLAHSHRIGLTIRIPHRTKPSLYFFYIDESGNSGAQLLPTEPIHWLVAVGVRARALRAVETEMLDLAVRFFGSRAYDPDFEFHGVDLFSGRRECNALLPRERVELYRELAAILWRHGCAIFIRGIDKAAYRAQATGGGRRAHPHAVAFKRLVGCINGWLAYRQSSHGNDPVVGLLVADEQREVDRETVRAFADWRDNQCGASAERFLVDTVHYIPSMDSWPLQLADCVSYLRNRYEKVMRSRELPGYMATPADEEIVNLWENFCACVVEDEEIWP